MTSAIGRVQQDATSRWAALQQRHAWLRHLVAAWQRMSRNNGGQYAAAITYFSFLALFPLLLLVVSITGFVLHAHPAVEQQFFNWVTAKVPGEFGSTLKVSIRTAIAQRTGVGVIGLVGVLLTGLGWISNLRAAIDGVWGRTAPAMNFLKVRLVNLMILAGLGVGTLLSLGLTAVGTSLTDQLLHALGLDTVPGAHLLLKVLGILIAVAGDMVIFWWVLIQLPEMDVPRRIAIKATLFASVGFEILKVVGTYTIAHTSHSPTAGPFAALIAVLVWIQLVARLVLLACALAATLTDEDRQAMANKLPVKEPDVMAGDGSARGGDAEQPAVSKVSPAAVGATLVGAGAVAGAVATLVATRDARAARSASRSRSRR